MEVLISMFVLAVGLLYLATLVPVGQFQVQQATNSDAASAAGRSFAFRQIKVKDMMDGASWVYLSAASTYTPALGEPFVDANGNGVRDGMPLETYTDTNGNSAYDGPAPFITNARPFLIDGLGLSANAATATYGKFPHGPATFNGAASTVPTLDRVSIKDLTLAGNNFIDAQSADRIFRATDDKNFGLPTDETLRPILVNSGGSAQSQSRGDISWMVMVNPAVWYDTSASPDVPHYAAGLGTTTVIVFHKRDLVTGGTPDSERALWADVQGVGAGSMDIQLRDTASTLIEDAKNVMKLRANQWVMLSAQIDSNTDDTPARVMHRWFRVVTVGEVELTDPTTPQSATNPFVCDLTLAGPDLNYPGTSPWAFIDADDPTPFASPDGTNTMICTICDGVVGVFEKTVQLDEPSLWSAH